MGGHSCGRQRQPVPIRERNAEDFKERKGALVRSPEAFSRHLCRFPTSVGTSRPLEKDVHPLGTLSGQLSPWQPTWTLTFSINS